MIPDKYDNPFFSNYLFSAADLPTKYANAVRALEQECRDADELLRLLRLDPDRYRTEGGYINIPKVRAALEANKWF